MTGSEVVQRINKLLKEKKISKQQFYNDCGISSAAYSQWNTGKTFPTRANLLTISEYLETTVEYLLTGEGQKNSSLPDGREREDEVTKELREIWDEADYDERAAILEVARLMKKRRAK